MKYMVAIDGTTNSQIAFSTACQLIRPGTKDFLYCITVVEYDDKSWWKHVKQSDREIAKSQFQRMARTMLNVTGNFCREHNIPHANILAVSNKATLCIIDEAKKRGVDCLVVGRRPLTDKGEKWQGSVSQFLIENAGCNVLIAKGKKPKNPSTREEILERDEEKWKAAMNQLLSNPNQASEIENEIVPEQITTDYD